MTEIEDITDLIGKFGKWQKMLFAFLSYVTALLAFNNLNLPFIIPKIDHWCASPYEYGNVSTEMWKNQSIPFEIVEGELIFRKCEMYEKHLGANATWNQSIIPCSTWEFDHSKYGDTITEKWNLVCNYSWLESFVGSVHFFGYLITAFVIGHISDRFGRRPAILLCILIHSIFGIASIISPYYWAFALFRFLLSIGSSGCSITSFVIATEALGPEYRERAGLFLQLGWSIGHVVIPGIAWLLRDWHYLQLACTLPYLPLLFFWRIFPESPRWLLTRGEISVVESLVKKITEINGINIDSLDVHINRLANKKQKEEEKVMRNYTFFDLFRKTDLRKLTVIQYFIWIVSLFTFYGFILNTGNLGTNVYLLQFLFGLMEFIALFLLQIFSTRAGRKTFLIVIFSLTGVLSLLTTAVPNDLSWLKAALIVTAKLFNTTIIVVMYIFTSELYPTVVRNVGIGSCSMVGGIGAVLAPFLNQANSKGQWVIPFVILGILNIVCVPIILCLPETKNKVLKDFPTSYKAKKSIEMKNEALNVILSKNDVLKAISSNDERPEEVLTKVE
ncbi:organic cation transporter protein-like [Centruroides vittatus]|uniref:organic cation transporter protein-like n=1 Tax=Centruroides vittatus TaxID=120091 RepID=UPI003510C97F